MNKTVQPFDFLLEPLAFASNQSETDLDVLLLVNQHLGARRKNRRQDHAQPVPQFDVASRLPRLPLERIALPIHFGQDIVHAGEILSGCFQA